MQSLIPIAYARNGYDGKFGIPRQSGRVESVETRIVFASAYRNPDALRGIEQWSHLWLIWGFSANEKHADWSPTVRPPRLGGNTRIGVFATRSPFRPNPIGLSSVRLLRTEQTTEDGLTLIVSGADLLNGTPIYDIKPYLAYTDSHPEADNGFASKSLEYRLPVTILPHLRCKLPPKTWLEITDILAEDPRPAYQHDSARIYGIGYKGYNVRFRITENEVIITDVE
ncbi:MAG: tRNA (N6-threonylcarbamoyladenosine(37)-N6)-methyltransferase TrmO [Paludibacter sp.]|nr:tRNA (N6-threonylcarbamoyladenosine(37)-N6)-methyltransferase TrmO [Bacteroidales bacterium]MCM1069272.1 tRNA (N6-threonylcarbamoyladenosine(37)-N6)-methyltransferase TrmO [Prevotella sp.]MCM1353745.1 tRNA (N6-threonylcarbamoyladenosine(37)-N6)-methyltransferase TrmO [Bacteroides sp.]MCM1442187.1 tRNA (N6-threonylcarbamoyladenosine(37)-N6)-methyltransferase TrmO [Muribaculum sp.]MCM1482149.1 tRNA (N6-threonylcarbamoyladenosine(37)-N6)-methyltransferase TrmO [Paludibacter sp.]